MMHNARPTSTPLIVAVLAGGQSRRMGRDKAVLPVGDETLLARTVRVARDVVPLVLVVGRDRPADWPGDTVFLPDTIADAGPLAGLVTALEYADGPVLLLGCDMPFVDQDALRWLIKAASVASEIRATVAVVGGQLQPLFAVYTPDALPDARSRLQNGRRSLVGLIEGRVEVGQFVRVVPLPATAHALADVDTPDDWRQASARLNP